MGHKVEGRDIAVKVAVDGPSSGDEDVDDAFGNALGSKTDSEIRNQSSEGTSLDDLPTESVVESSDLLEEDSDPFDEDSDTFDGQEMPVEFPFRRVSSPVPPYSSCSTNGMVL